METVIRKIKWQIGEQFDDAGDGHVSFHYATGESADGKAWKATAVKCDDYLVCIEEIEEQ